MASSDKDWAARADCLDEPWALFFEGYETDPQTAQDVDALCSTCPVKRQCLQSALDSNLTTSSSGVFGGVYLMLGKYSKTRNSHKTEATMRREQQLVEQIRAEERKKRE